MYKIFNNENGFTFIEIVAVLIIIGILSAIAISRSVNHNAEVYTGADTLRAHLRYAQAMAMNYNPTAAGVPVVWGLSGTPNSYWLFQGTDTANRIRLPEDDTLITADRIIDLSKKKIKFDQAFTIYFDNRGIPYSAYADVTTNTPLSANKTINVQPINDNTPSIAVTVTPLTGYVP